MIRFASNVVSASPFPMRLVSEKRMRQQSHFVPTDVGQRTVRFLKGARPRDTAKLVSRDTGIGIGTIEKMIERQSAPSAGTFVAMTLAYGPAFLAAVMPDGPAWLDRAVRAERLAQLEAEQARITRELEAMRR